VLKALAIAELAIRDVRNLVAVDAELAAGLNVVHGDNGHGKTSLLEAIYLAASSRSFRTAKLGELVRHGAAGASVRVRVVEQSSGKLPPTDRVQTASLGGSRVAVRIDGTRPASLAAYATRTPVVVFHPDELTLSTGPASQRRRLIDRLVLYRDPLGAEALSRYGHALRSRQDLLKRGVRSGAGLEAYEELCAVEGARVTRSRQAAIAALLPSLLDAFARIAEPGLHLEAMYAPGGGDHPEQARSELAAGRDRDAHRASAGFGPHRDDLAVLLGGHPARTVASQGQHRALVLSLKAAESATIADATGLVPILLLDDVSSELDEARTTALFDYLGPSIQTPARTVGAPGEGHPAGRQIVLTTTRPGLIPRAFGAGGHRRDFRLEKGVLRGSSSLADSGPPA
jgi:DNA replication and repair protein RecF